MQDAAALTVDELGGAPRFVDAVAGWLHGQWYAQRGESMAIVRERLEASCSRRFPACYAASLAGEPVGTFTLEPSADPQSGLPLFCLSNVFVDEAWRGRGIGRQLCEAAAARTRELRIPRLSLFTASHGAWYAAQGWRYVRPVTMRSRGAELPAMLMSRSVI